MDDATITPASLVEPSLLADFIEWARDSGYDESFHDRMDSKSLEIQRLFLEERGL